MLLFPQEEEAPERANAALANFKTHFQNAYLDGLRRKIGLYEAQESDALLLKDLFERMHREEADFTLTFRRLCSAVEDYTADAGVASLFKDPSSFADFAEKWRARLAQEGGETKEIASILLSFREIIAWKRSLQLPSKMISPLSTASTASWKSLMKISRNLQITCCLRNPMSA